MLSNESQIKQHLPIPAVRGRRVRGYRPSIKVVNIALGMLLPVVLLIIWSVGSALGILNPILLPSPLTIVKEFISMTASGELLRNLQISAWRAFVGFLIGGGLGFLMGLWVGFSYRTERLLDPSIQMLRTLPHLALAPLFVLWFGFGETSKILLIAKGAFFPLYVNTFLGLRSVEVKLFEVARVLQFSRWQLITKLIVPSALPHIFLGIRLSLGIAWLGLVVAEMMGSSSGVGYMINDARFMSITSVVFVGIIVFAAVGKLTDSLVKWLEHRLLRWRGTFQGEGGQ